MSALWRDDAAPRLVPMRAAQLDAVLAIERLAYAVPWTRGNFSDSLANGYLALCLQDARTAVIGYCVAMVAAGELHLLNLTVAPAAQGRGHGRWMLAELVARARDDGAAQLWLEVRVSNARARGLYRRFGLLEVGQRRAYYPPVPGSAARENAVVMSLRLDREP